MPEEDSTLSIDRRTLLRRAAGAGSAIAFGTGAGAASPSRTGLGTDGAGSASNGTSLERIDVEVWFADAAHPGTTGSLIDEAADEIASQTTLDTQVYGYHNTEHAYESEDAYELLDQFRTNESTGIRDGQVNFLVVSHAIDPTRWTDRFDFESTPDDPVGLNHEGVLRRNRSPVVVINDAFAAPRWVSDRLYKNLIITGITRPILGAHTDEAPASEQLNSLNSFGSVYEHTDSPNEASPLISWHTSTENCVHDLPDRDGTADNPDTVCNQEDTPSSCRYSGELSSCTKDVLESHHYEIPERAGAWLFTDGGRTFETGTAVTFRLGKWSSDVSVEWWEVDFGEFEREEREERAVEGELGDLPTYGDDYPETVSYTYPSPGEYTAELSLESEDGVVSTAEQTIVIEAEGAQPPEASKVSPTAETVADPYETLKLDASTSTAGDEPIETYEWQLFDLATERSATIADTQTASVDLDAVDVVDGPGQYYLRLLVTDAAERRSSSLSTIDVQEDPDRSPDAAIASPSDGATVDADETLDLDASASSAGAAPIDRYEWELLDPSAQTGTTVASGSSASVVPRAAAALDGTGEYELRLIVHDENGRRDSTRVAVQVASGSPVALLDMDEEPSTVDDTVTFDLTRSQSPEDASSLDYHVLVQRVTEDGYEDVASTRTASLTHTFEEPGEYYVLGQVRTVGDRTDWTSFHVTIIEGSPGDGVPLPSIRRARNVTAGETTTIDGYSAVAEPEIDEFSWTVFHNHRGRTTDKEYVDGQTLEYEFDRPGQYILVLEGHTADGVSAYDVHTLYATNPDWEDPLALLDMDEMPYETGDSVTFDLSRSEDPEGAGGLDYHVLLQRVTDDEHEDVASTRTSSLTHTFEEPGEYYVLGQVTTADDRTSWISFYVTIIDWSPGDDVPLPGIDTPRNVTAGETASVEGYPVSTDPGIDEYSWTIFHNHSGRTTDKEYVDGETIEYEFDTPGQYLLVLEGQTDDGASAYAVEELYASNPEWEDPLALLDMSEDPSAVGDTVTFDLSRSEDPESFGELDYRVHVSRMTDDGEETVASTWGPSLTHTFEEPGEYFVSAQVSTADDREDWVSFYVTIIDDTPSDGVPLPAFDPLPNVTAGETATIDAHSAVAEPEIDEYSWRIFHNHTGRTTDHENVDEAPLTYEFDRPGQYILVLEGTTADGASARAVETVYASGADWVDPLALLDMSEVPSSVGDTVTFELSRSEDPESFGELDYRVHVSRMTDDGEETVASTWEERLTHTFEEPGEYFVSAQVTTADDRTDWVTFYVTIVDDSPGDGVPLPSIPSLPSIEAGETASIEGETAAGAAAIDEYSWQVIHNHTDRTTDAEYVDGKVLEYEFDRPGRYVLVLEGETDDGTSARDVAELLVSDPNWADPVPELTVTAEPETDADALVADAMNSYDPASAASDLSYDWSLRRTDEDADASPQYFSGPQPTRSIEEAGTYRLELTVSAMDGRAASDATQFTVEASGPDRISDLPESETVPEGEYTLVSGLGFVLHAVADPRDGGSDLDLSPGNFAEDAHWEARYQGAGQYELWNVATGSVLGVAEASMAADAELERQEPTDGEHQRWYLDPVGDDEYRIVSAEARLAVRAAGESSLQESPVTQQEWTDVVGQRWRLESVEADPCVDRGAVDGERIDGGQTVCDVDGDGNYRDVNGDGDVSNGDVVDFFGNQHVDPWDSRTDLFDFDGDGNVGQSDVVALFEGL